MISTRQQQRSDRTGTADQNTAQPTMSTTTRIVVGAACGAALAVRSYAKGSLTLGGSVAGAAMAVATAAGGYPIFVALLVFFLTSTKLTRWRGAEKARFDADYRSKPQRDVWQVLANGLVGSVAGAWFAATGSTMSAWIAVAHFAACAGDTWSSEVGIVLGKNPVSVWTLRPAIPGQNGGITVAGTVASFAGGAAVGIGSWLCSLAVGEPALSSPLVVVAATLAGAAGSLADSIIGGALEPTYVVEGKVTAAKTDHAIVGVAAVLDNDSVNFVASAVAAVLVPVALLQIL